MSDQTPPTPRPGEAPPDDDLRAPGEPAGTQEAVPPTGREQADERPAPTRGHAEGDDMPAPREPQAGL
jgi:hypothetical protein